MKYWQLPSAAEAVTDRLDRLFGDILEVLREYRTQLDIAALIRRIEVEMAVRRPKGKR